jgi:hypothetical protein
MAIPENSIKCVNKCLRTNTQSELLDELFEGVDLASIKQYIEVEEFHKKLTQVENVNELLKEQKDDRKMVQILDKLLDGLSPDTLCTIINVIDMKTPVCLNAYGAIHRMKSVYKQCNQVMISNTV